MGIISNELKIILAQLEKSKTSINNKYEIMNMDIIQQMPSSKLSEYIDKIPVVNTFDATATPGDIYYGRTAYVKAEKITGLWSYTELTNADLTKVTPIYNGDSITHEDTITANIELPKDDSTHYTVTEDTLLSFNTQEFAEQIGLNEKVLLKNHSVLNIHGTIADSSDATATANDILSPKTAYVNNEKITGNIQDKGSDNILILTKAKAEQIKEAGYYGNGIEAKIDDFDVVYVTNSPEESAFVETHSYSSSTFQITQSIPTYEGKHFKGWSISPTGSSQIYVAGQSLSTKSLALRADTLILYAAWKDNEAPSDLTLEISFANNSTLNDSGTETATITLIGGDDPEGGSVTKALDVSGALSIEPISNNVYTVTFDKTGYYVAIGSSIDMFGAKAVATQTIEIKGASGSSSGSGQFVGETFDSGWLPVSVVNGCYISAYQYNLKVNSGHSNSIDTMIVYGRKTNGTEIVLYDVFDSSNVGKPMDSITPGKGNLYNSQWSIDELLTLSDNVRQVRFVATTPNHASCVTTATINFNIELTYDSSLDVNQGAEEAHTHTYGAYTTVTQPTCTTAGTSTATCSSCYGVVRKTIEKLGHTSNSGVITTSPTCTVSGIKTYSCTRCNSIIQQTTIGALGHNYDSGVITKAATTKATGIKTYTCSRCNATRTESIPMLENNYPNFSLEGLDAQYRWGYYELKQQTNSKKYIEVYNRLANIYIDNANNNKYELLMYGTTNDIQTFNTLATSSITLSTGLQYITGLNLYLKDVQITLSEFEYIWGLVYADYPEALPRWKFANIDATYVYSTVNGYLNTVLLARFSATAKSNYQYAIDSVFGSIAGFVKYYYNIGYTEDTFYNNNHKYTETEMKKIGKVIHDFLVTHNTYGDANSTEGYNQILWPAMSNGDYDPVCASYAHAFKYCCWKFGINAIWVPGATGTARDGLHAWNMVMYKPYNVYESQFHVSSNWQEVDITWDDPVFSSGVKPSYCRWTYFNKTTSFMTKETHVKAIHGSTSYGVEKYKTFPANGNCNCTSNTYSIDSTDAGGTLYVGF